MVLQEFLTNVIFIFLNIIFIKFKSLIGSLVNLRQLDLKGYTSINVINGNAQVES